MARSGWSRMTAAGSCVAQITRPSPAMIFAISCSGIGPCPLSCTASYPIARTLLAVAASAEAVWQKSRTV